MGVAIGNTDISWIRKLGPKAPLGSRAFRSLGHAIAMYAIEMVKLQEPSKRRQRANHRRNARVKTIVETIGVLAAYGHLNAYALVLHQARSIAIESGRTVRGGAR